MKTKFYVTALIVIASIALHAQEENINRPSVGLLTLGAGVGYFGPTIYLNASYIANNNLLTVRFWSASEFQLGFGEDNSEKPNLSCSEIGVLYGRTYSRNILTLSLSAGLAYVDGIDRGNLIQDHQYEQKTISTLGVPFEAMARFDLGLINIGFSWYGDINSVRTTNGGMIDLSFKLYEK